ETPYLQEGEFLFSSSRRHTSFSRDWSSDVCSSDLLGRHGTSTEVTGATTSGGPTRGQHGRRRVRPACRAARRHHRRVLRTPHSQDRKSVVQGKSVAQRRGGRTGSEQKRRY